MKFEDLQIGQASERSVRITAEMVSGFAGLVGDHNPVHVDAAYAATTPFKAPIAHGTLTYAFIGSLIANELPGRGSILVEQSTRFIKPVYLESELRVRLEITELMPAKNFVKLTTQAFVGDNIVIDGYALIKIP